MPLGMLGKYERLDVLGHGVSGIVYLAKDTLLGRQVALKEVAAQGDEKERVLEEARVLDRLRHPNIVQVIGADEIGGKVVIAMEYVRGRTLQDVLRQTPQLPVAEAARIAIQICDGLAYAHAHRTVHRDVKPANIILADDGVVKLVDFGLAETLGTHSFAGGAGTYAYMAPEDFHEEERSDRQSDIWAAGVILYEMLTGQRPFRVLKAKDPFAWKRAIEEDPLVPATRLRPDAPPSVDTILARALARDKRRRYAEAEEMARDLRALGVCDPALAGSWTDAAPAILPRWSPVPSLPTDDEETIVFPGANAPDRLPGALAPASDIDAFLRLAPDHWEAARAALTGGALADWLGRIGEGPLADLARQMAAEPKRDGDERLRDFLYRAGLETTDEARRAHADGARRLKAGRHAEALPLLQRAVRLDPAHPAYHQDLARGLRAVGDAEHAMEALDEGLARHPGQRTLVREQADLAGGRAVLSTMRVDFGVLRRGQSRSANVVLRNTGAGVLRGRVLSAPGWVRVEPATFTTRQRQPLTLTANTDHVWQAPATYDEQVVLETTGGRQEIAVTANVLPARLRLAEIGLWYLPILFCCLLPLLLGLAALLAHDAAWRHLWPAGLAASGLLCGSLFVLTITADTGWTERAAPLLLLLAGGLGAARSLLGTGGSGGGALALVQTVIPILVLLILQTLAAYMDPRGWGRWQRWRWILAATSLLVTYALLHLR